VERVILGSAARQTAAVLREEILGYTGSENEWFLGSEDDVSALTAVSRPTLRQATRLLEEEQVLIVRRGLHGGLYGRRPTADGVSRTSSVFLRSAGTTYDDLLQAGFTLHPACARLAASSDEVRRRRIRDFYCDHLTTAQRADPPLALFLDLSGGFQREVAAASASPVLRLNVNVLMDLARPSGAIAGVYQELDRRTTTIARHQRVADAIWAGNGGLAARRMLAHLKDIHGWADRETLAYPLGPHV
jgi:DNA-binding FadR family transcriptional regulator